MTLTTNDEFESPLGQIGSYTPLTGGFQVHQAADNSIVAQATPAHDNTYFYPTWWQNRHIDIRSFITADPSHGRPQSDLERLHQMQNAYHQAITVDVAPTSGTWKLYWEDTGETAYALTTDYTTTHTSSVLHVITRVGGGSIASGEVVHVSYTTGTASYVDEAVTLTGTTPAHLAHEAENVVTASITVSKATNILSSAAIAWNAPGPKTSEVVGGPTSVERTIETFVAQVFNSPDYTTNPTVTVVGETFPYVVTFLDETEPPLVREIGSWAPEFGIYLGGTTDEYKSHAVATLLHTATPCVLTVANLRTDEQWLQSAGLSDSLDQDDVETAAGSVQENWTPTASTGMHPLVVGRTALHNNWRAATVTFDGTAVATKLVSRNPLTPVNLTALNADRTKTMISMVMPEWTARSANLSAAACKLEFTSDDSGLFSDETGAAVDSGLFFSGHMTGNQFRTLLSNFGSATNWSRVTAVRITLVSTSNPTNNDVLTIMALRALDVTGGSAWVPLALDVNTRTQHLEFPVTLTGDPADVALISPLVRSTLPYGDTVNDSAPNTGSDPSLTDGTISLKFNSGTKNGSAPASHLVLYMRQVINPTTLKWEWIQAQLTYGGTSSMYVAVMKVARDPTTHVDTYTGKHVHPITLDLVNNTDYLFSAALDGSSMQMSISAIDSSGDLTPLETIAAYDEPSYYDRVRGRVGWWASFGSSKDSEIDYFRSSHVSFATMRTAVFHSRTPIDGAQLFVEGSTPSQLWTGWSSINPPSTPAQPTDDALSTDYLRRVSAFSYKFAGGGIETYSGVESNIIDFDDWSQTFLDFQIWAPHALSAHNSVQILTDTGATTGTFKLSHDSAETGPLAWNATALQIQTALAALGTVGVGNVTVTPAAPGAPLPAPMTIKFGGAFTNADISTLLVVDSTVDAPVLILQSGVRPQIFLQDQTAAVGDYTRAIGPFNIEFIPGTWSHVRIDLNFLGEHAVGPYKVQLLTVSPTTEAWNVDKFVVGRRAVAWELRAIADGTWHEFRESINNPVAALHLSPTQRGTAIQLQARALVADAWISTYTLKPHYTNPGRIV